MSPEAVILALASAVRPSTSLAAVYALLRASRPRVLLAAFCACGFAASAGVGVLVVAVLHGVALPGGESRFVEIVDIVAGVAAIGFAAGIWFGEGMERVRRRRTREEPSWVGRTLREPSLRIAGFVGVATHVPGLFYLVALNAIAAGNPGFAEAVVQVLVYNGIWFAVPLAALVLARRRPEDARDLIERINGWMRAHDEAILIVVFGLVGLFLVVKGVVGLVG
jgi:Sap, sulfolipid-1-addressing protein